MEWWHRVEDEPNSSEMIIEAKNTLFPSIRA
jgi:hypothetical protein